MKNLTEKLKAENAELKAKITNLENLNEMLGKENDGHIKQISRILKKKEKHKYYADLRNNQVSQLIDTLHNNSKVANNSIGNQLNSILKNLTNK